jgi:DNA polymerase III subunit gamma/tau
MAYISLYRKYRSQNFGEISGQEHVTRTLGNAITSGRVGHAYLFCGPRGTGKTSVARLLAKCLNCNEAPTLTPCNACPSCDEINAGITGASFNVQEFDAASKRGIDDIRQLRETIGTGRWGPGEEEKGRKVVIIDEVHMLTTEAFNALLKTLEEPPEHVLFVLATTDVHKVPATIVSRCQRFDFHRGSLEQIGARLRFVAEQENVEIEEAAIERIARGAGGSWRDALGLLEQVLAYSGERVTASDVTTVLGTVAEEDLARLAGAIAAQDGAAIFAEVDRLISDGRDIRQLTRDLTEFMRQLLLVAVGAASPGGLAEHASLARAFTLPRLVAAVEQLAATEREFRESDQLRIILEVALIRLAHLTGAPAATPTIQAPPRENGAAAAARVVPRAPPEVVPRQTVPPRAVEANSVAEAKASAPPDPALVETPTAPSAPSEAPAVDLATLQRRWVVVVEELKRRRQATASALANEAQPVRVESGTLMLGFQYQTLVDVIMQQRPEDRKRLEDAIGDIFKVRLRVVAAVNGGSGGQDTGANSAPPVAPPPQRPAGAQRQPPTDAQEPTLPDNSSLVHEVIEIFDGRIIDDEPR